MVISLLLQIALPVAGITFFIFLVRKMIKEKVSQQPVLELFMVFAIYGALMVLTATSLFWQWSAMASLGFFFLLSGAPLAMLFVCIRTYKSRKMSPYHLWTFRMAWLYFIVLLILTFILYS